MNDAGRKQGAGKETRRLTGEGSERRTVEKENEQLTKKKTTQTQTIITLIKITLKNKIVKADMK